MNIFDLIPEGRDNAISKAALTKITGLKDRDLRQVIHRERRAGHIIITDPTTAGYYRPTNTDQSLRFIKSMRHRAAETLAVADATERALMEENGQESMEDW